jgi:hypothetical protein
VSMKLHLKANRLPATDRQAAVVTTATPATSAARTDDGVATVALVAVARPRKGGSW